MLPRSKEGIPPNTPAKGTRFYSVNIETQQVEVYVFVEESIIPGAYSPTWCLRRLGQPGRFRTSPSTRWRETRREAIQDYLDALYNQRNNQFERLKEATSAIEDLNSLIATTHERINNA